MAAERLGHAGEADTDASLADLEVAGVDVGGVALVPAGSPEAARLASLPVGRGAFRRVDPDDGAGVVDTLADVAARLPFR